MYAELNEYIQKEKSNAAQHSAFSDTIPKMRNVVLLFGKRLGFMNCRRAVSRQ
jgi:hypothetical protein